MFGDGERSPSWHSPPLTADFGPQAYPTPPLGSPARPPVQSGWFPLQDTSSSSTVDPTRATQDMYADHTMMPQPAHRPLHNAATWPQSPAGPYADPRSRGPYGSFSAPSATPSTTPSGYSPLYGYGGTSVTADATNTSGFGWQDARPMAPTGLDHLRMPYDDMHRVHAAAQGMHAMMGGPSGHPMGYGRYSMDPTPLGRKKHKEISVGRWTSEEHHVFLKGLDLYQGPSWGEIARMIGTRTSTQVRTHAQKFFTKLARANQVLPYFESQIQKERTRLITQGAMPAGPTTMMTISAAEAANLSVTPTSTTVHSYAFNTLSPPQKREHMATNNTGYNPQRSGYSGYEDPVYGQGHPRPLMQSTVVGPSPVAGSYGMMDPTTSVDPYKQRLDSPPSDFGMVRKPTRPNSDEYVTIPTSDHMQLPQSSTPYGDPAMMPYTPTTDPYRDPSVYQATAPVHNDWNDANTRPWPQSVDVSTDPTHVTDPDSLPSVTRLLYRNGPMTA